MPVPEVHWIALIAASELAVVVSGLLLALALRGRARSRADHAAATELVQRIRDEAGRRRNELDTLLGHHSELEAAQRQSTAARLLKAESEFYDHLVRTYVERNPDGVRMMHQRLQEVLEPYQALAVPASAGTSDEAAVDSEEPVGNAVEASSEPAVEKSFAQGSSPEVELYKETLNRVFREYTAMFGVRLDDSTLLSAQEIILRLETGQLDCPESATGEERQDTEAENRPSSVNVD